MLASAVIYIRSWDAWTWFGFLAQFIFFLRFFVQWISSERAKRVTIPVSFWYLSLVGGALILVYAIVRHDVVFITASALSLLIYGRNLRLHRVRREADHPAQTSIP